MLVMSRQYDTHGFDRQRYQAPIQPVYLEEYARQLPLTLGYAERPQMRSAPITAPIERHQLDSDQDTQGSNSQSRRRIAVACARCRKRKIKCSGDPGNGSGCQNCRAAGSDACNFFRVGSFPTLTEQQRNCFDGSGMALLANAASFQQAEYPTRTRFPLRLATSLPTNYAAYHECESPVDNHGIGPLAVPSHEAYGSVYQVHDSYSNGRPYLAQTSYNPPTYSESPVQENAASAGYSHSQAAYIDATTRQQVMTDGHGVWSVNSLQHSLPTPTTDRKLPMPAQNPRPYYADDMLNPRPRTSSGTTSQHFTMASAGYTRVPPTNWSTENLSHGLTHRSSATALYNETMAPPPSVTSISTASSASEVNSVNYAASMCSSVDSPATEVESVGQSDPVASESMPTRSSAANGPVRSMYNTAGASPSESVHPRHSATIGLYTYSSEKSSSSNDLDGVLVNGDDYEPLKHSQPINYMPIHYPPRQQTSAARHTQPSPSHPQLEASSEGARAHQAQRRCSIPSVNNS